MLLSNKRKGIVATVSSSLEVVGERIKGESKSELVSNKNLRVDRLRLQLGFCLVFIMDHPLHRKKRTLSVFLRGLSANRGTIYDNGAWPFQGLAYRGLSYRPASIVIPFFSSFFLFAARGSFGSSHKLNAAPFSSGLFSHGNDRSEFDDK